MCDLKNNIKFDTHISGNCLDLLITPEEEDFEVSVAKDGYISDHYIS